MITLFENLSKIKLRKSSIWKISELRNIKIAHWVKIELIILTYKLANIYKYKMSYLEYKLCLAVGHMDFQNMDHNEVLKLKK